MNEVKQKDSETWEALEKGDFAIARTGIPFTDLFVDQALEQKIRQLKVVGGIIGITLIEKHLNDISISHLSYQGKQKSLSLCSVKNRIHSIRENVISYQVPLPQESSQNSAKIKTSILQHCG